MKITPQALVVQTPRERAALSRLRQLLNEPGLLRASLIHSSRRCGKSYCRCAKAKRYRHFSWYIGHSRKGRPHMKYLPEELVGEVRAWVTRYREAHKLLDKVSYVYWERLKRYRS